MGYNKPHYHYSFLYYSDRKFGVKGRLSQALQATLTFTRNHTHSNALRTLQPVLTVLKQYSNNGKDTLYTSPSLCSTVRVFAGIMVNSYSPHSAS